MRMIDADTLKRRMLDYYQYSQQLCEEISDFFDNTPTIEPEWKRGRWRRVSADRYISTASYMYKCSECGETFVGEWNFCPNCGADMQMEGDE